MNDYERAKLDKKIAESSYEDLKKHVEPYLVATKGLTEDEIERINELIQLESRKIAVEREESKKAMELSEASQRSVTTEYRDKWNSFYKTLPRSKRVKVDWVLKVTRNSKDHEAVRVVKNKLMKEPERIDRLPDPKTQDKDKDISI